MDRLDALRDACDALAALPVDVPDVELAGEILELLAVANRLQAQICSRVAVFDGRGGALADGAPSTAAWLRGHGQLGPRAARELVVVARALHRTLPATASALAGGDISFSHASVITRAVEGLPAEVVPDAEEALLAAAQLIDPARLHAEVARRRAALAPDRAAADAETAHARRRLHASGTLDGMVSIDGLLDPAGGELLLTALHAMSPPVPGDTRTPAQRRADALVEMCRQVLGAGTAPTSGGEKPHVTIIVDLPTLLGRPGAAPAELGWTGPASLPTLLRHVCDASVTRIVTAGSSDVLDAGRKTRLVSPAQRRVLDVRDGGCVFPRCDRPPGWCDAHHLIPWASGGPTDMSNLALLCPFHHHLVHEGGWTLIRGPDQTWSAHPPRMAKAA
jgi:hypothetical protein